MCPSLQALEIGYADVITDDDFAVDRKVSGERLRTRNDQRIAFAPVVASAGEETDLASTPTDNQPKAVVFDFVNPLGADRRVVRDGRDAGLDKAPVATCRRRGTPEHLNSVSRRVGA